jgi:hypothetical protein
MIYEWELVLGKTREAVSEPDHRWLWMADWEIFTFLTYGVC